MKRIRRLSALLLAAAVIAGCSSLGSRSAKDVAPAAPVEPPKPVLAAPIDTHRFEFDPDTDDMLGQIQVTVASKQDTLSDIARRFNVGYEEIVRANPGVDPWLPGEGREIVVPTQFILPNAPRDGVVINVAALRVYYFPPKLVNGKPVARKPGEKQVVYTHPIGIGKVGWATPEGTTKVTSKQKDPVWRPTASIRKEHRENGDDLPAVVPAGPDNPLGKYKFTLGWPTYLIHGTNKPYGVGLRSSHGCIRLYPEDIEKFFEMIPTGTKVHVVNQPTVFGWHNEQLYVQAVTVLEDDPRDWKNGQKKLLAKALSPRIQKELKARDSQVNWDLVAHAAHDPRGLPVSISHEDVSVQAVLAAAPRVANRIPVGANWDGADDPALQNQGDVEQMVSEQDRNPVPGAPRPAVRSNTGKLPATGNSPRT